MEIPLTKKQKTFPTVQELEKRLADCKAEMDKAWLDGDQEGVKLLGERSARLMKEIQVIKLQELEKERPPER